MAKRKKKKKLLIILLEADDQDIFLAGIHDNGQFTIITRGSK